jgi:hypothetical protein
MRISESRNVKVGEKKSIVCSAIRVTMAANLRWKTVDVCCIGAAWRAGRPEHASPGTVVP